jgi:16S rRNA (adenine1518-N6/adenine1519-N6)-dimethyltransferase
LERLFALRTRITKMVLTMQTEVADRLLSPPGTKTYGSLSLFAQYHAEIRRLFTIPPTCFYPPPEVQSTVVELIPVPPRLSPAEEATFRKLVRAGFGTRRKTLRNALKPLFSPDQLAALPIDLSRRAETLSLEEFVALAKSLQPQN